MITISKDNSLRELETILKEMGYREIEKAQYDNIDCIVIFKEERRGLSSLDVQLYIVPEGDNIKVIGGDWIGYGSWEDFSKDELLEYESELNLQKKEILSEDKIPPEIKGIMATLEEIRNPNLESGNKATEKNKDYER